MCIDVESEAPWPRHHSIIATLEQTPTSSLSLNVSMVPQSMLLAVNISDVILLSEEAITKESQHSPHPHHLGSDLLHIVPKQNVPNHRLQAMKVEPNDAHVQLSVAVHVDAGGDFPRNCCGTDCRVILTRWEELLQAGETIVQESDKELSCLIEAIEVVRHHVQVQPQCEHLACRTKTIAVKKFYKTTTCTVDDLALSKTKIDVAAYITKQLGSNNIPLLLTVVLQFSLQIR